MPSITNNYLVMFFCCSIKVFGDILYFNDGRGTQIQIFNISEGPASLKAFGPQEFFSVPSMAIYSSKQDKNDLGEIFCDNFLLAYLVM